MINKALFEEENLYIVGESHLCEETYAAIRKTIENNQAVGVLTVILRLLISVNFFFTILDIPMKNLWKNFPDR